MAREFNESESSGGEARRPAPRDAKRPPAKSLKPKRAAPPEGTHAESYYYVKQMQSRTPMVVVMQDGERLSGVIEWYDRDCLKLNRDDGPNLLIYKRGIKYAHKQEPEDRD